MKYQTVDQFIDQHFSEGSRPPKTTVWRWIREGRIPATKLGRRYYIPDSFDPSSEEAILSRHLPDHA